jgi:hypothetical protein
VVFQYPYGTAITNLLDRYDELLAVALTILGTT